MIKNIVFDMGKVLVNYDSYRVCKNFMSDPQMIERVNTAVFISPEWILLDMGLISEERALEQIQRRLPDEQHQEMAALCLKHWHEYCMWPVEGMEALVGELKAKGYHIYLCSNASSRLLDCYQQVIPGIGHFSGVLFSAEVKCIKPQKEIYRHLFERFSLKPQECYFIDDLPINIEGGRSCGMDGYCFEDGDVDKLRKNLHNF